MPTPLRLIFTCLACGLAAACAGPVPQPPSPDAPWVSEHERGHALVGRIWQPSQDRFVEQQVLVDAVAAADYVLLGEKHDNVDHHRLQAWLVAQMVARGRVPAVAFEMFTGEQAPALAQHLADHPGDAAGIGAAVGWEQTGWPEWPVYQPIAEAALGGGAPLLAASLPRPAIRALAKDGAESLGAERVATLRLDVPLPEPMVSRMRADIGASHCGQLPESMIGPMVTVMTARDAHMADVLLESAKLPGRDSAVLIAGKGHTRADQGVPYHLRRRQPGARVAALALMEVKEGSAGPRAYAAPLRVEVLPYDFVWFTPVADPEDPCAKFAGQLQRSRERHQKQEKP